MSEDKSSRDSSGVTLATLLRDISQRRRLRTGRGASPAFIRAVLTSMPATTVVLADDGTIRVSNRVWTSFRAVDDAVPDHALAEDAGSAAAATNYFAVCDAAANAGDVDAAHVVAGLRAVTDGRTDRFSYDYPCRVEDGERWFQLECAPLQDHAGVVITHTEITRWVRSDAQVVRAARCDHLTGLASRIAVLEELRQQLSKADARQSVAVVYLGIDGFKDVNDSLGLDIGDAVLREVAARLAQSVDGEQVVGRIGGDEFVIVMPGCDTDEASTTAEQVRQDLRSSLAVAGLNLPLSACVGISAGSAAQTSAEGLLRDGHVALYAAKADGRDRCRVFQPRLRAVARERLHLIAGLGEAIPRQELVLYYQPIFSVRTAAVTAVEALIRWQHPTRGLLLPKSFMRLVVETGLVVPLGRWALAEAAHQTARWQSQGIDIATSVNVGAAHLSVGTLEPDVRGALESAELRPDRLALELTETDLVENFDRATENLQGVRELGVLVAIDDFGSGYSSLGQLTQMPADGLKLDRSLVMQLTAASTDKVRVAETLFDAVTSICGYLGMWTVAEGVETAEQRRAVVAAGCSHVQGYFLAKPMQADDVAPFVRRRSADVGVPYPRTGATRHLGA